MLPRLAALALLATASLSAADAPRPLSRPVLAHDLASLTHADAERLAGKPALYRIVLDSQAEEIEGRVVVDCTSADAVHRTAWLLPGVDVEGRDALTVRARLRVIRHGVSWGFPELVEYRLVEAACP